jgi:hypothetical protein
MIVLFFIFVLVAWSLLATGARRALPLALGAGAAWLAWRLGGDVAMTILVGLAVLAVVAFLFDWLIVATRWRSTFIALEAAGACAFGVLSGFAIEARSEHALTKFELVQKTMARPTRPLFSSGDFCSGIVRGIGGVKKRDDAGRENF